MAVGPSISPTAAPDPRTPTTTVPSTVTQGTSGVEDIKRGWNEFFGSPQGKATMLQFGVSLLSGRGFGRALGDAGEASSRVEQTGEERRVQGVEEEQEEERLDVSRRGAAAGERRAGALERQVGVSQQSLRQRQATEPTRQEQLSESGKDRALRLELAQIGVKRSERDRFGELAFEAGIELMKGDDLTGTPGATPQEAATKVRDLLSAMRGEPVTPAPITAQAGGAPNEAQRVRLKAQLSAIDNAAEFQRQAQAFAVTFGPELVNEIIAELTKERQGGS